MMGLIPDFVWVFIGGLVAAVAAFVVGERKGKSQGRSDAQREALEADTKRARDIERKADEARSFHVDRHPVDRLRDSGRIRD